MLGQAAISLALTLERHALRLFANGTRPGGILSFKSPLSADALTRAKAAWTAAFGGEKQGSTAVMDGDASFTPLLLTSVDAQFLEMRAFAVLEIARLYKLPPSLLQDYGRATWANGTEMARQFHDYCLTRWLKAWEGEVRIKLFFLEDRDLFLCEHDTDDLLLPDLAARAKAYKDLIGARVFNPNECRELERHPPYAGGDAFAPLPAANPGAPAHV